MRAIKLKEHIKGIAGIGAAAAGYLRRGVRLADGKLSTSLADFGVVPRGALAVSIGSGGTSIAYATTFLSRLAVKHMETVPFEGEGYPAPEDVATAAAGVRESLGLRRTPARLVIPKSWAIVRPVELPLAARENLGNIVSYEMDRLTPFTAEEVFYDYYAVAQDEQTITLLLSAVKKQTIEPYLDALKQRGVEVAGVGIDLLDTAGLCSKGKEDRFIFLRMSGEGVEGCLHASGLVAMVMPRVGAEAHQKGRVFDGVHRLLETAGTNGDSRAILWSDEAAQIRPRRETGLLAERLTPENVNVTLPEDVTEPIPYEALAGALGPLRKEAKLIDLLAGGERRKRRRPLLFTALFALAIAVVGILYLLMPLYFEGKRLEEMDRQIALRKGEARRMELLRTTNEKLKAEVGDIKDFKRSRAQTLTMMRELYFLFPKTVWLTRLRVSEASIDMEGYAKSAADVLARLKASKTLARAEFASPPVKDQRYGERFVVKIEMEGSRKDAVDKGKAERKQQ